MASSSSSLDPNDPASFNHRFVQLRGTDKRYHLIDQLPPHWTGSPSEAPTLLLCHGFPDLWYGWRYQIHHFASVRGWRVICPSQLGYGETSQPRDIGQYSYKSVAYDMNALLDEVGVTGQIVVVGHDWGGMVAWRFANYFPERVKALACVCTPYQAPASRESPEISDEVLIRKFLPNFGYQLYFKTDEAEQDLSQVIDLFLQPMHSPKFRQNAKAGRTDKAASMGSWVREGRLEASVKKQIAARNEGKLPPPPSEQELDYYISMYKKSGLYGPLAWYKTRQINFHEEREANLPPFSSKIPCLQLPAAKDAALPPKMCLSPTVLSCFPEGNLEVKVLDECDHWCLQDETVRDNVTNILGDWIENVLAGKWRPSKPATAKL